MPEFLTEKNFQNDFINNKDWIFGLLNPPKNGFSEEKLSECNSIPELINLKSNPYKHKRVL